MSEQATHHSPLGRLITVEEHISYDDIFARCRALGPAREAPTDPDFTAFLQRYFGAVQGDGFDVEARLAHMDAVGVDLQVVSSGHGSPSALNHPEAVALCRTVNDRVATMVDAAPTRFAAFATLPMVDPQAADAEFRRCIGELGFKGWLMAGTFAGDFLDADRFRPLLRTAAELDVPVYVHPAPVLPSVAQGYYTGPWSQAVGYMFASSGFGWHVEAGIQVLRLLMAGIFDEIPGLKVLSGHWGETVPGYLDRIDDQVGMALPGRDRSLAQAYRDQVWVTPSGLFNEGQLQMCLAQMGPDHLIWSEDYPYLPGLQPRLALQDATLDEDVRVKLAHGNAERLLHL